MGGARLIDQPSDHGDGEGSEVVEARDVGGRVGSALDPPARSVDTAIAGIGTTNWVIAAIVAPTVPEIGAAEPMLAPLLMPETTRLDCVSPESNSPPAEPSSPAFRQPHRCPPPDWSR